jgi:hypothetical protein
MEYTFAAKIEKRFERGYKPRPAVEILRDILMIDPT